MERQISEEEFEKIIQSRHNAPHTILGPHYVETEEATVIRAFLPYAEQINVLREGVADIHYKMHKIHPEGLFEVAFPEVTSTFQYELITTDKDGTTLRFHDPYSINSSSFVEHDRQLVTQGTHYRLYDKLGAHPMTKDGVDGTNFAVWAPNAERVSVVGTFNRWDGRCHPMRRLGASGIWELFIPELREGELYKYEIRARSGAVFMKTDPFAFYTEILPKTASIVYALDGKYHWRDEHWMATQHKTNTWGHPVRIYDLDIEPWLRVSKAKDNPFTYKDLAVKKLLLDLTENGFTHVKVSAAGHPDDMAPSYYTPDARYGKPEELMAFVDMCHLHGIGVILNWIPSVFPHDAIEFAAFDGTALYEHQESKRSGIWLFNVQRSEVRNFLIANALFWLDKYHIDGLRTDPTAATLYLDYLRNDPNRVSSVKVLSQEYITRRTMSDDDIEMIVQARHHDPYSVLGPHHLESEEILTIRAFLPHADQVYVRHEETPQIIYPMKKIHEEGLFEALIPAGVFVFRYRLQAFDKEGQTFVVHDPYALPCEIFTQYDRHLFAQGNHYNIFEKLGAHPLVNDDVAGVSFAVWAPNAERVSVVGSFNRWDGRCHQMKRLGESGICEIFIPGLAEGTIYKYEIRARNGDIFLKTDPYAFYAEVSPGTASVVYELKDKHEWHDDDWMQHRAKTNLWEHPVSIYEVHIGSWRRTSDGRYPSYKELAVKLIPYVKRMGFTHIELLPIAEHPYEPSWGYQISHFYAPTSRYGKPEDLMEFVDICHQNGIGVILDWVAAHFPKDAHALAWFDGTCLYEHADPRRSEHPDWGTLIFNYGRREVENFLIANALFWLETYHLDGLRADAVATMLYLDYSRQNYGDWMPNIYGGNENLEAIEFIKHINSIVHKKIPGVMMIAEESTAWPAVTKPVHHDGLGFGFKWNMGWMHDVLFYMKKEPIHRKYHHNNLTFGIHYAFDENFILPLSHDEVVHLKGSLINKMPGNEWEKFANLRLLYTFMYAHPGKKLLFMGGEFGQLSEWNHAASLEWHLLDREPHKRLQRLVRDLNKLYCSERALYQVDVRNIGFEWIDVNNADENVIAFIRKAKDPRNDLFFAMNFSPRPHEKYRMGVPYPVFYQELLNSDEEQYWGHGKVLSEGGVMPEEIPWHGYGFSLSLTLPPLGAIVLKPLPPEM